MQSTCGFQTKVVFGYHLANCNTYDMRSGFRLRLGLDIIMMAWALIERRVLVGSRLRLSLGLVSIMNMLIIVNYFQISLFTKIQKTRMFMDLYIFIFN